MKLFISADIEGTAGIASWPETELGGRPYDYCANELTQEVKSACEGALEAGAESILVKDAHDSARNIDPALLPEEARILRGWTGGPMCMMAGLDRSFDAAAMVGYHSAGGTNGNPLAHTMDPRIESITLNGALASEFMINAYAAASVGVPTVFVSGDRMLCESARKLIPAITAVSVSEGIGNASVSLHPAAARRAVREGLERALKSDLSACMPKIPVRFKAEVRFGEHAKAYRASFYPGAKADGMKGVVFSARSYFDILKFFLFTL